ncbi:hypothetical protein ACOMHN_013720 [Nucella lapillus]
MTDASQETGETKDFYTGADDTVSEVRQEVWEVPIGAKDSGLRVLLGEGAAITELLMPQETREVFLYRAPDDVSEDAIRSKFQAFGKIIKIDPTGKAAVEGIKEDEMYVAKLENRRLPRHKAEFKARLSWNRRRATGFGHAIVFSQTHLSKCMEKGHLSIGGNTVSIVTDIERKKDTLYLHNLPWDVTEDLIKRSVLHCLGEKEDSEGIVGRVSVPRESVASTHQQDLDRLKREISGQIEPLLTSSTVQVTVFEPKSDKTARFMGEARFSDPIEGLAACKTLQMNFSLGGCKVTVEPVILASLRVSRPVYDACKLQLDEVITRLALTGVVVTVEKQEKTGNYLIGINAKETEEVVQARAVLNDVIRGDDLECGDAQAVAYLLTSAGRQMLMKAGQETSAYIAVDNRLRTVSIHGSAAACTKVRLKINQLLHEVSTGTVCLKGQAKPPGLLKVLNDQYGPDLDLLRQTAGLHAILVSVAVKNRHFPVSCCNADCNLPLAWRDFNYLSRQRQLKLPDLAANSLAAFVLANQNKVRFCTTPDCPMAYRVTDEAKAETFLCPECGVRICTGCHQQAHDGMSCSDLRSTKDVAEGVETWVSQDPKKRKACPGCKSPIEKTGGCNRMQCSACEVIFCWLCCQEFPSSGQCYDHLTRNHNGIFAEED